MAHKHVLPVCSRLPCLVVVASLVVGCSGVGGTRSSPDIPVATTPDTETAAEGDSGEFTIAASMNDTWNTVGQVLVRTDGVTYESRAQILGIYALRYRGERFLIRTQAVVIGSGADGMSTRVVALGLDGKVNHGPAAIELLKVLKQRVPLEIEKYSLPIELKDHPPKGHKPKRRKPKNSD